MEVDKQVSLSFEGGIGMRLSTRLGDTCAIAAMSSGSRLLSLRYSSSTAIIERTSRRLRPTVGNHGDFSPSLQRAARRVLSVRSSVR